MNFPRAHAYAELKRQVRTTTECWVDYGLPDLLKMHLWVPRGKTFSPRLILRWIGRIHWDFEWPINEMLLKWRWNKVASVMTNLIIVYQAVLWFFLLFSLKMLLQSDSGIRILFSHLVNPITRAGKFFWGRWMLWAKWFAIIICVFLHTHSIVFFLLCSKFTTVLGSLPTPAVHWCRTLGMDMVGFLLFSTEQVTLNHNLLQKQHLK